MLSIDFIRQNKEKVIAAAQNKNRAVDVEKVLAFDDKRKELIQRIQKLREERNTLAKSPITDETKERGRVVKEDIRMIETDLTELEKELYLAMSFIPNVPLDEVPIGKSEEMNVEIKKNGTPRKFDFQPKSHTELGLALDLFDTERGSKVAGFRGYFLKNEGAILQLALLFYVFQKLIKKGYTPVIAPAIVKGFTLFGTGQFPWGEQDVYKVNDDDAYLAGTAEVPMTAYHSGEVLQEKDLPKRYVAFSPCYRKEAGAYGKDTKGLYRVHEFFKIEQVIIGKADLEDARKEHEELERNAEEILQELGLPYRVLLMCTGDMGEPQILKHDIETWMPSREHYGETMSNSIMGDFQCRRLNIRYKNAEGKTQYCYSYNNTALASPRILIAVLENYQNEDGSITVPEVLRSLTGFDTIQPKK